MKNLLRNMRLLFILFFIVPLLLSVVLLWTSTSFLEREQVSTFVSVSGYIFTLSSLILVFVLIKTFKVSDHKRSVASEKFLEKKAFENLSSSLENILHCIKKEETNKLYVSCVNIREVYNSLNSQDNDVDLKAYKTDIKRVFNLINTNKLTNIGYDEDIEQLKNISQKRKHEIVKEAESLLRYLKQRRNIDES